MHPGDEFELREFDCPRCGTPVQERFWGPCQAAMHVVANHVATRD